MSPFSIQTISAIADVVTGGSNNDTTPPIGVYRSGPKLERFFRALNLDLRIGNQSRLPATHDFLAALNGNPGGRGVVLRVIESVADPREYVKEPEKSQAVVEHLNQFLPHDGCELRLDGKVYRLVAIGTNVTAAVALQEKAKTLRLESVTADFERATNQAESDPADAITSACSTVESVCKCILDEMERPYPSKKDISSLVHEVARHLNLSQARKDLPPEWERDIKMILTGLISVAGGIGALRTHAGDAHGKGKTVVPVDARIARLAIHAASTLSLFLIETWQKSVDRKR